MLKIGHRGAAGYVTENTLASFKKAIALGVDMVEFDVQATADGQLVVFHDNTLDRMTNGSGYLSDFTYAALKSKIRIKGAGEPIPTLDEVCNLFINTEVKLYVEIKKLGIEREVLKILSAKFNKNKFIIASFYHKIVRNIKDIDPGIQTLAIMAASPVSIEQIIADTKCDYLGLDVDAIEASTIERCHKLAKGVFVWTVDDKREIERIKKLGADGIVSNFPDRI